jgi:RNA polymerase sigma factor for flagellar operon FliA
MKEPSTGEWSAEAANRWVRLIAQRDGSARERLIERHLPVAQKVAAVLYSSRVDDSVEFDDYLQYARIGLLEAIDRYDPARAVSFATFASHRVRGAILNGIDRSTELALQGAERRRLRRERLRSLKDEAAASSDDGFVRMVDLTLSLAIGYLLEESGTLRPEPPAATNEPYRSLEMKRLRDRIGLLVAALPERERAVIRHHYYEHKEFVAIAELLEVSRGRVAQLHARALKRLAEGCRGVEGIDACV